MRGRVVLIGDAAHGMAPFLGFGANSAIEDGAMLADALPDDATVAGFARERAKQMGPLIGQSRRLRRMMHRRLFTTITRLVPSACVLGSLKARNQ
jgi:2-polyprenyl-6-methoxyphenol hydroxylase-like FAD-dependent oxidoreductase